MCLCILLAGDLSSTERQSIPGAGHLFRYVTNQVPTANSAFHSSEVGKWVPASAGKAKASMVHSISGCTRAIQVKLWNPASLENAWSRAISERLRGVITTRRFMQLKVFILEMLKRTANEKQTTERKCSWYFKTVNSDISHFTMVCVQKHNRHLGMFWSS